MCLLQIEKKIVYFVNSMLRRTLYYTYLITISQQPNVAYLNINEWVGAPSLFDTKRFCK